MWFLFIVVLVDLLHPDFTKMHAELLENSQRLATVLTCPLWVVEINHPVRLGTGPAHEAVMRNGYISVSLITGVGHQRSFAR
jgi:hypothetical protein